MYKANLNNMENITGSMAILTLVYILPFLYNLLGNFQDGLREGFGMWKKYENSEEYKGLYCKDKKNGIGMFNWSNGNYYKGEYKNDNREGIG